MTEIVRRAGGSLIRGIQVGPARDLSSVELSPIPAWGNIDEVPEEVMREVRRQGLMPKDLLTGGSYQPIPVPGKGGGMVEEAGGWLVGSDCLVQFDAFRPQVFGQAGGTDWTVSGKRHEFTPPATIRFGTVPQDSLASGGPGDAATSGATLDMIPELDLAELLPATARIKLVSVFAPSLADSYMRQHDLIPGLSYVEVLAVAANATVCVAVLGRLEVQAHHSDTAASLRDRMAKEPWRLGILRGQFS